MAIRHQPKSEKHPYLSPTTPGLYVTFRDYIIELVCMNVNPKIGPRFWSDKKYWGPKYGREIRGVTNLGKELNLSDALLRRALVEIIRERNIKALVAKKTIATIVRWTNNRVESLTAQRLELSKRQQHTEIDNKKNATFVDTGRKTALAKIRDEENG
jgi:hypothetical protein